MGKLSLWTANVRGPWLPDEDDVKQGRGTAVTAKDEEQAVKLATGVFRNWSRVCVIPEDQQPYPKRPFGFRTWYLIDEFGWQWTVHIGCPSHLHDAATGMFRLLDWALDG